MSCTCGMGTPYEQTILAIAKSVAVLAADHAFRESGVIATSRRHQLNIQSRLMATFLGTDVRDHITGCIFRIDVVGQLPTYEPVPQRGGPHVQ